jgi:hypothetical protein
MNFRQSLQILVMTAEDETAVEHQELVTKRHSL